MDSDVAVSKYEPIGPDAGHAGELRQAIRRLFALYPDQIEKVTCRLKGDRYRLEVDGDLAPQCVDLDW